ncbi:MAG: hypothetical protein AAB355_02730, partial [Patescibacteria group bacterium]
FFASLSVKSPLGVEKITMGDIRNVKGVGVAKATQIIALVELSKRLTEPKPEIFSSEIWGDRRNPAS